MSSRSCSRRTVTSGSGHRGCTDRARVLQPAARGSRPRASAHGEPRDSVVPERRARRRRPAEVRRRCDVRGETLTPWLGVLRPGARRQLARAPGDERRTGCRARARRDRGRLPGDGGYRHSRDHLRRGARPLAQAGRNAASAERVPGGRRAGRTIAAAHSASARARARESVRLARRRSHDERGREYDRRRPARRELPGRDRGRC